MPRIFKGSESTLRLLISKTGDYQALTGIKIKLYTTDIENAIEIIDGIQVCKNIAIITLAPRAFMGMEDGLINYIIDGATEDDVFHTERQSNYMLKSLSYINEDGVASQTMTIESNGGYRVTPNDGLYVDINVNVPDLNGSYDDGFNVGYEQGKTDGVNEQKGKLESINITENGTYTKEDGYNHIEVNVPDLNGSYDEGYAEGEQAGYNSGYDQGQADVAANARVLNVTENGNYLSKFSDPVIPTLVTGVYADGTKFYNYAELGNKVFNTNIPATPTTRLELWYKGDNTLVGDAWNIIIGAEKNPDYSCYQIRYYMYSNSDLIFELGRNNLRYTWDENAWHHILIAKETENASSMSLWVDEVKIGDFGNIPFNPQSPFYINCIESFTDLTRNANGYFGMIKIDDVVIIPTADGFKNVNTGELLEVVKDGGYKFTDNSIKYGEGELYKTINVDVIPKINLQKEGLRLGYSTFKEVPEWADFKGITNLSNMFQYCSKLQTIPLLDTSNVTDMNNMFANCGNLQTIPQLDTSNVSNMGNMFNNCRNLQTIPLLDTNNVTDMNNMFYACQKLQTIPQFNTSNVNDMGNTFAECYSLTSLPALNAQSLNMYTFLGVFGYNELSNLTDFGGFINLKQSLTSDYNLKKLPNLTKESCINVLNGLYDFTGNGETPGSNQGQLKVHANFLTTVGDEISIGTNKGWQITV